MSQNLVPLEIEILLLYLTYQPKEYSLWFWKKTAFDIIAFWFLPTEFELNRQRQLAAPLTIMRRAYKDDTSTYAMLAVKFSHSVKLW